MQAVCLNGKAITRLSYSLLFLILELWARHCQCCLCDVWCLADNVAHCLPVEGAHGVVDKIAYWVPDEIAQ